MKTKKELVVKSNTLIEASYRLTLVETQIILFAVCRSREMQQGLSSDSWLTISAKDFAHQFDITEKNAFVQLKEAANALFDRIIRIYATDPETGKDEIDTRWLSAKAVIDRSGGIRLMFAPIVIPYITRLGETGQFTSYQLDKIAGMSSTHAIRLYELLVQYLSIGRREIEIAWLREVLELVDDYPRMFDLKKNVIDFATKQINDHSNLAVGYTQRKTGRAITHLDFDIKEKQVARAVMEKKAAKVNPPVINKAYVDKHARPGESYSQAFERLKHGNEP